MPAILETSWRSRATSPVFRHALQTVTRTVTTTLFTGTNYLTVGCPTGYVATGSGFTVPAVIETQHYVSGVNFATLTVSNGFRNVTPITVSQSTTGATTATVQVTCARVQ